MRNHTAPHLIYTGKDAGLSSHRFRYIAAIMAIAVLLFAGLSTPASAASYDDVPYTSYTYPNGAYGPVVNKDAYVPAATLTGQSLGLSDFASPQDAYYANDGYLYLLNSGNSRIVVIDKNYSLVKTYENLQQDGQSLTFKNAASIYVSASGHILLSDPDNKRVLICNKDGDVLKTINSPDTNLLPKSFQFIPINVVEDKKGFIYVISKGSYYGAMIFLQDGKFLGFYGANQVNADPLTVLNKIYNMIFSNNTIRSKSIQKLPFQMTGLSIGPDDFVYSLTSVSESGAGQLRKLSPGGDNIMTFQGSYKNYSATDFDFSDGIGYLDTNGNNRINNFIDISVDSDGFIYLLDFTYGKIFVYDDECNLVSVFGTGTGKGTQLGTFVQPTAVTAMGKDLLVVDEAKNNVTIFHSNAYCENIKKADRLTLSGDYTAAIPYWEQVNKQDKNYLLAYSGLAKGYLAQGKYALAMDYAKSGGDRNTYAQAFKQVRGNFISRHFIWLFPLLLLMVGGILTLVIWTSKRRRTLVTNEKLRVMMVTFTHPLDTFNNIKFMGKGSSLLVLIIMLLLYATSVSNILYGGFMYVGFNPLKYNALYTLLGTVGILVLWSIVNWAVCTLLEGKGRFKEILTATSYAVLPIVLYNLLFILMSHVLVPSESSFLFLIRMVCFIWSALLIVLGMMTVHDYGFLRAVRTSVLTILCMVLSVFIIVMVFTLLQDFVSFIMTVATELFFRYNG